MIITTRVNFTRNFFLKSGLLAINQFDVLQTTADG